MKLSRILRRRKYGRHQRAMDRKIDLFKDGTRLDQIERPDSFTSFKVEKSPVDGTTDTIAEPQTVRDAFEAFKRSTQQAY